MPTSHLNATHVHGKIRSELQNFIDSFGIEEARAFQAWCLYFYHELTPDDAYDQSDTLAKGDGGIDGWFKDESQRVIHLWQCKWSTEPGSFDSTPLKEVIVAATALLRKEISNGWPPKFQKLHAIVKDAIESGYSLSIHVGLSGEMTQDALALSDDLILGLMEGNPELSIDWDILGLELIDTIRLNRHPSSETLKGKTVKFKLQSASHIAETGASGSVVPGEWAAAVVSLNAKDLGRIADDHKEKLFSLNVRFALNLSKRIRAIRETLVNPETEGFFWLYNNGITILSEHFEVNTESTPPYIEITNPQIVNGCQSTSQIKYVRSKISDKPSILARVIKTPNDEEIVQDQASKIAKATNNQTPVLYQDLHSNDPVQKVIKLHFDDLEPPWFYETKRGEWGPLPSSTKAKYKVGTTNRHRKLEMAFVGQSWRIFSGRPVEAIVKKKDLFEEDSVYNETFRSERDVYEYLVAYMLKDVFTEFWKLSNQAKIAASCGPWFTENKVKSLMEARGQLIAHSSALAAFAFKGDNQVWTRDRLNEFVSSIENFDSSFSDFNKCLGSGIRQLFKRATDSYEAMGLNVKIKKWFERSDNKSLEDLKEVLIEHAFEKSIKKEELFKVHP